MSKTLDQGYFVEYGSTVSGPHRFCGGHEIPGAMCPTCKKRLLLLLELDPSDPPVRFLRRAVPLLCCWTCNAIQAPFAYCITEEGDVSLLRWKRGGEQHDFPYGSYPALFPGSAARLVPVSSDEQELIRQINAGVVLPYDGEAKRLGEPRHQVGGEPFLVQGGLEPMRCPSCKEEQPFLAAIADDNLDPRGFVGNPFVQVVYHYCRTCRVITGYQAAE